MIALRLLLICVACAIAIAMASAAADERPTMSSVLGAATAADWRRPDPANMLYLQLEGGQVVFEMAPQFAPQHVANIRKLVAAKYFDGLAIIRSQDNYVVQWGDPADNDSARRPMGSAAATLEPEFFRSAEGVAFKKIDSRDAYANEVGFAGGFPAGRDGPVGRTWLIHCYGMLGVGRAESPQSGNGAELYVVTGHAPRHLDRNVTLIGRVIAGIGHLSTLPRGTGSLGFYESEAERVPIVSVRFGSQLAEDERIDIEILRTDTDTFARLVEARRYRAESWFVDPAEAIEICNVPLPTRPGQ